MGVQQSKEELLYEQVSSGNIEGTIALRRNGAGLEWIDKEGKTPLILSCMWPHLINVAKVLIELGANVNAYRAGSHAGTALHHAAKKGLDQTVNLLLSSGANPYVMNDDCQTPLDLARSKGHCNVVRAMEARLGLFCGWMREVYGPSIIEAFAPQWVQRKIWAVVVPCDSRNPTMPQKFELAIYPDLQAAQPREVIQLWKTNIDVPKFDVPDPAIFIVDKASKTRYKFLPGKEGDKHQLAWFYNACRGIPQQNSHIPTPPTGAVVPTPVTVANSTPVTLPVPEDVHLAMAINASIQSALAEGIPVPNPQPTDPNSSGPGPSTRPTKPNPSTVRPSSSSPQLHDAQLEAPAVVPLSHEAPPTLTVVPSAPPMEEEFYSGPVQYPMVDSSPVDLKMLDIGGKGVEDGKDGDGGSGSGSGSCVICLDAPVEGACIPCGHMAGCMACLNEIKGKNWGCPVCRADIDQVIRLYAV